MVTMMFDMQTVFYGLCGLLVALSISYPKFYSKYCRNILVLAWGNGVALVVITFMILQVAEDAGAYRAMINDYSERLIRFFIEDQPTTLLYMLLSVLLNENLRWLAVKLDQHNNSECDNRT